MNIFALSNDAIIDFKQDKKIINIDNDEEVNINIRKNKKRNNKNNKNLAVKSNKKNESLNTGRLSTIINNQKNLYLYIFYALFHH